MSVKIERAGDIALVTVDNPPVNALGQPVRQALWEAAEELDSDAKVRAVVLLCAGRTFIAGADVTEFGKPLQPPHLPEVIARIEGASRPWVAAIHGSALGGGLEVALACRFRVAVRDAQLGLPEVTLGVVPGAGGTVRLPRLVPLARAVAMITSGRPVEAAEAERIGLIDAIVEGDLRNGAIAFARAALGRPLPDPLAARPPARPDEAGFWPAQETAVAARARGQDAPLRALACIQKAVESDFDTALAYERKTFLDLRDSDQARALRHVFFAERAALRPPEIKGVAPRDITRVGVVGGGTMGAGITAALLAARLPVVMVERDAAALERGQANLRGILDSGVKRGSLTEADRDSRRKALTGATDHAALAGVDLVIEAVFEDMQVKREVFAALDAACRADAVLATNTSYLNPEEIAQATARPERVLGLHFFSPAHVMKLLEVVPTAQTAPEVVATGFALARRLGKVPVLSGICDGFIGNRILKIYRTTAERLLLTGVLPDEIDQAMRDFGLPMGPFQMQDLAGLDIGAAQRRAARERGEAPFAPISDRLVEAGRLGQKTGAGWYDYAAGERNPQPSDRVAAMVAEETARAGLPLNRRSGTALADRLLFPMIDEAARILDEGIARRAVDIDLVEIHGYGFPRWRGGLMHYAESRGLPEIVATLAAMHAEGLAAAPSAALRRAADRGGFEA
jgi:3-hydroxyacyl-CoA dehydrogenase